MLLLRGHLPFARTGRDVLEVIETSYKEDGLMSGSCSRRIFGARKNLLRDVALTAPSMIVTIYGDIVVPRGGVLWMAR